MRVRVCRSCRSPPACAKRVEQKQGPLSVMTRRTWMPTWASRTVVGHDATDLDAQVGEVGHGLAEEVAGGGSFFIGQQGGEGDAGVVVDGDIKKLPAGAAGFILGIAGDAMAGLVDTSQLLNVDVQ